MQQVCTELEKEKDTDNEAMKRERFDTVLALMHKVNRSIINQICP